MGETMARSCSAPRSFRSLRSRPSRPSREHAPGPGAAIGPGPQRPTARAAQAVALLAGLVLFGGPAPALGERLPCLYTARATPADPMPERVRHADCATVGADGELEVGASHLAALDFLDGPAPLRVGERWYYVLADGRSVPVLVHDNGADAFREGLARTVASDGRVGFVDRALRVAIPPRWDFAWPFEEGRALVCRGCRRDVPDADGHAAVSGGRWGWIDTAGEEVVPVRLTRDQALAREAP